MATTLLNAWIYKMTDKIDPSTTAIDLTSTTYKRYRDGFYTGNTSPGVLVIEDKDGDTRTIEVGAYTTLHIKGCTAVTTASTITSLYCFQMCD